MNIVCDIVKDLSPICVDGTASDFSSKMVHRHLKRCNSCKEYYKMCKKSTVAAELRQTQNKSKEKNPDIIYLPDNGYMLVAERVEKSLRMERIAIISAAIAVIITTLIVFTRKGKKNN